MGILVDEDCVNNYLTDNEANNNRNYGIALSDYCDNNTISQNIACYNGEAGIILSAGDLMSSYYNSFIDNIVNNNTYGIHLEDACHFTIISENVISGNEFGIFLQNAECSNNSIYNNCFITNDIHAIDDGVDNKWNSSTIGNYWDNHTSPDDNKDGIVDNPYTYIGGTAGSIDYLPLTGCSIPDGTPGGLPPGVIVIIIVTSVGGGLILIGIAYMYLKERRE
jgi:parallel beta-helix repeat protein